MKNDRIWEDSRTPTVIRVNNDTVLIARPDLRTEKIREDGSMTKTKHHNDTGTHTPVGSFGGISLCFHLESVCIVDKAYLPFLFARFTGLRPSEPALTL